MKLKKRLNFRIIITAIYAMVALTYIVIGLSPVEAQSYEKMGRLEIPAIGLDTEVVRLNLEEGSLKTPDTLVGGYSHYASKVFLIGHAATIFQNLKHSKVGDTIIYSGENYVISEMKVMAKSEIDMGALYGAAREKTLVLMTCIGEELPGGDATHRLILTAKTAEPELAARS